MLSLSRLFTSVYSLTLVDLLLTVQLHVAAKTEFADEGKEQSEARVTQKVREAFMLRSTDYFVTKGLNTLLGKINDGIRAGSKEWLMGSEAMVGVIGWRRKRAIHVELGY